MEEKNLRPFSGKKIQSKAFFAIEYAILIAVVTAALIGMMVYMKRALCGKWRTSADTFGYGRQYEPGVTVISEE